MKAGWTISTGIQSSSRKRGAASGELADPNTFRSEKEWTRVGEISKRLAFASAIIVIACAGDFAPAASAAQASQQILASGPAARSLSDQQRDIIKHRVLRLATVSIVPLKRGEPTRFAIELAAALRDAGADVSIVTGNWIHSDQAGLIVLYDHTIPPNASVFLALQRAGLNPTDQDIPGAPVVEIEVGPKL
jgi:hypothetical protein